MQASAQVQRITELYERDQRSGAKATLPTDIPVSYEAMTPEWLTHVMCRNQPGAKVVGFSLSEIDNGSSNRRRVFLQYNAAGQAAGLPPSVFCKASHVLINRISLGLSGAARGEAMFYNNVRPLLDIDAPRAYLATYDPESFNSIVMLDDLAGQVEFGAQDTVVTRERAESMVRLMASYHSSMFEHPELVSGELGLPTWQQEWATTVRLLHMDAAAERGVRAAESVIPARLFSRAAEIYPAMQRSVAKHDQLPSTLLHSDTHLKNWYVRGQHGMGLMDWQLACVGNWSRDVAYAIAVALQTPQRREWERDLLQLYLEECRSRAVAVPSLNEAWDLYRQQLFTALAWWTITLCPTEVLPADMQPSQTAMEFIGRIARAIDDLDALAVR
ncbi:MAG: aminoglycoside phosphotransferase family protein [Steroidobacteraceae bacterium]